MSVLTRERVLSWAIALCIGYVLGVSIAAVVKFYGG